MEPPTFVLCTRRLCGTSAVPRARTVVFRGMWACLPANPKNPAPVNPDMYRSHLPTVTTDARMDKTAELDGVPCGARGQSGGGGPVEAVFWATAAKTQWRLRGRAYVIGPDIDSEAAAPVRDALAPHMRRTTTATASWSWARELTAHFGNLSPLMRGTFRNPPPGTPLGQTPAGGGLGLGQEVQDLEDEIARASFRVVVIVPDAVDRVDLSDPARCRRWSYSMDGSGTWKTTELWP